MSRTSVTRWLQLLLLPSVALLTCSWAAHYLNEPDDEWLFHQAGFNPGGELQRMSATQPEWVLLGNSMLNCRLDEGQLSQASGIKALRTYRAGSQSAVWFLMMKQVVAASTAKPKVVTVFFRQTDLTWPDFRTQGLQKECITAMDGQQQPEWQQVLGHGEGYTGGATYAVARWLNAWFPDHYLNQNSHRSLENKALRLTKTRPKLTLVQRREELNDRFSSTHLRADLGADAAPNGGFDASRGDVDRGENYYVKGPKAFSASPDDSFLPHMIALAKVEGWKLHFHRVKQRPKAAGDRGEGPITRAYIPALKAYLAAEGCLYTSEVEDPTLTIDMYADGDHIHETPEVRQRYLANFWQRVGPMVSAQR
jgi:hypothetical protein